MQIYLEYIYTIVYKQIENDYLYHYNVFEYNHDYEQYF